MRSFLPAAIARLPATMLIEQIRNLHPPTDAWLDEIRNLHPPTGAWLDELALAWAECDSGALLYGASHSCPLCRGEEHAAQSVP